MAYHELAVRTKDWSVNLEDAYYTEHLDELLHTAIEAVSHTAPGHYVNLVTPEALGHPGVSFIDQLQRELTAADVMVKEVRYIDECGCGGHVTRVFR